MKRVKVRFITKPAVSYTMQECHKMLQMLKVYRYSRVNCKITCK